MTYYDKIKLHNALQSLLKFTAYTNKHYKNVPALHINLSALSHPYICIKYFLRTFES